MRVRIETCIHCHTQHDLRSVDPATQYECHRLQADAAIRAGAVIVRWESNATGEWRSAGHTAASGETFDDFNTARGMRQLIEGIE